MCQETKKNILKIDIQNSIFPLYKWNGYYSNLIHWKIRDSI